MRNITFILILLLSLTGKVCAQQFYRIPTYQNTYVAPVQTYPQTVPAYTTPAKMAGNASFYPAAQTTSSGYNNYPYYSYPVDNSYTYYGMAQSYYTNSYVYYNNLAAQSAYSYYQTPNVQIIYQQTQPKPKPQPVVEVKKTVTVDVKHTYEAQKENKKTVSGTSLTDFLNSGPSQPKAKTNKQTYTEPQNQAQVLKGIRQYRDGEYENAIGTFSDLLKSSLSKADEITVRVYLSFSYIALGMDYYALEHFKAALNLDPNLDIEGFGASPKVKKVFAKAKT